jgi:hypothetical protein
MEASFGIGSKQSDFKGALLYKLHRKYAIRTSYYYNSGTTSVEDTAKSIHLLVVWDIKNDYPKVHVELIEYTDGFTWDEDKLWLLHNQYKYRIHACYGSNTIKWLLHDDAVMKVRFDITHGTDYKLDIIISGRDGKYRKPNRIDLKRLVLT